MQRFNSYGVARPYLIQDHDCHIQLPCNQPSFEKGEDVKTEHLLGPNPQHPDAGTTYMGAFAFLVRITCIWSNILREIHFLTLKQKDDNTSKHFDDFVSQLEKWRTGLPEGLAYSNDNLAGQIKVGTTGAFVMMHVMWHMAMAYVHRYIRTGGAKVDLTNEGDKNLIVESIRRAFIHGDAILQIMYHVRRRRDSMPAGEEPIVVNAPFLGQAIFDACYITVTRALEVRNEPGGARDQKIRVNTGLAWLRELKRYWKPLGGMYKRIKKICNQLDTHSHPPSSFMPPQAPTPESSTNSGERDSYMQNTPWMPAGTLEFDHEPDGSFGGADLGNGLLLDPNDAISFGGQFPDFLSMPVPQRFFNLAFGQNSISSLASYAVYENGFPDLYQIVTSSYADPTIPAGHPIDHHISPPIPQGSQMSFNNGPTDIDEDASDDDDDDTQDPPGQTSTSGGGRDIHTTYFDPGAVHDGKLQDSASDTSGRSRRASEAGPTSKSGPTNRMDVLNLINTTGVEGRVAEALPQKYTTDKFTGAGGTIAPDGEERD